MAKQTRIQVAAPEGGIIYDIGHERTEWQKYSDSFKPLCRDRVVVPTKPRVPYHSDRPHPGKKATRAAKRARVAAMKAAGHYRGHNSPFVEGVTYLP